jgi:alpha-beta hydrolase superfamily lysophospholipase
METIALGAPVNVTETPRHDLTGEAGKLTGTPFWLDLDPDPIYAVLHAPACAEHAHSAVLILPTFGWDNECSYRVRRDWATRLAQAGIWAARIDFPGTEDSVGSPLTPGRVSSWIEATSSAAQWLRRQSGCERVTVIGIGLGGLIGYEAAAAGATIDDLILWGVRASGRAYARELRAYAAFARTESEPLPEPARPDGALGIGGHVLAAETAESLSLIDLSRTALPHPQLRRVLLIGRDAHGVDAKLVDHLRSAGVSLSVIESDDYHRLVAPPELGERPEKTISASISWLLDGSASHDQVPHAYPAQVPEVTSVVEFDFAGMPVRERIIEFETSAGRLVGICSEPVDAPDAPFCLVTVNAGALRHTGPNRLFVEVTRRAAASGIPAVRLDLPGLGDSDGTTVRTFERKTEDDAPVLLVMQEVYDEVERIGIAHRFVPSGLCLGGYFPIRILRSDPRSIGSISVNAPAFRWTHAQRKQLLRKVMLYAGPDVVTSKPKRSWLTRLLQPLSRPIAGRLRAADRYARRHLAESDLLWRLAHRGEIADHLRSLAEFGRIGAPILLLFSEGETMLRILEQPKIAAKLREWPNIQVERVPTRDHLLRPLSSQDAVIDRYSQALLDLREEIK